MKYDVIAVVFEYTWSSLVSVGLGTVDKVSVVLAEGYGNVTVGFLQ